MKGTQELKMLSFDLWEQYQVDPSNRERSWNDTGIQIIHISLWRHYHCQTGHNNKSSTIPAKRHKPCSHYRLRADRGESLRPSLDPYSPILSFFWSPTMNCEEFRQESFRSQSTRLWRIKWSLFTKPSGEDARGKDIFLCWNITWPNVPVKLWFNYLGPHASYNHLSLATVLASVYTSVRNASLAEAGGEENFYGAMASV